MRRLQCRHYFHESCIDQWLLEYKPFSVSVPTAIACPVCAKSVVEMDRTDDDEPEIVRELEWLAEVQRSFH